MSTLRELIDRADDLISEAEASLDRLRELEDELGEYVNPIIK